MYNVLLYQQKLTQDFKKTIEDIVRESVKLKIKGDLKRLLWLFHVSFAQKRKKLTNNLSNVLQKPTQEIRELLTKLEINPDTRAEDLTMDEWQKLFNELG